MRVEKKVIASLNKCYAVAVLKKAGQEFLLAAAEKNDPCLMFDMEGNQKDTLWETDGGIMTMEWIPGTDGEFLSTQAFFSPNDSANARIVRVAGTENGWKRTVVRDLPFVHRFGILQRNGSYYLIACTLKSAHAFKNDWTCPGRVWVAPLPDDLSAFDEEHQLEMTPLISGLYKNHGFCKVTENGCTYAVVGTENGIYKVVPPETPGADWEYEQLTEDPASDMLYMDFDRDGEKELLVLTPFHGDRLLICKKMDGTFRPVYEYPKRMPFLHAIYGCEIGGKPYAFVGNREEDRELLAFSYDPVKGYQAQVIDSGAGPANVLYFTRDGQDCLLAANRETDEVAIYSLYQD